MTQCSASANNIRCKNLTIDNSSHCIVHRSTAAKLYLKYKDICNKCENLDIHADVENRIDYVTKCYVMYNKAWHARAKHRQYAFVPELYDKGHNYQFTKLNNQIIECEMLLSKLYQESEALNYLDSISSEDDDIKFNDIKPNKKNIKEYKEHRRQVDDNYQEWIEHYIEHNKVLMETKNKMIFCIWRSILKLFVNKEKGMFIVNFTTKNVCILIDNKIEYDIHSKIIGIALWQFIRRLIKVGYFNRDLIPKSIEHKIILELHPRNNLDYVEYLSQYDINELEKVFKTILIYQVELTRLIFGIVPNILSKYKIKLSKMTYILFYLIYDFDLAAFKLKYIEDPNMYTFNHESYRNYILDNIC